MSVYRQPRPPGVRRLAIGATALLFGLSMAGAADPSADGVIYSQKPELKIPFTLPPGNRVQQVELYVSTDDGRTWQQFATAQPHEQRFRPFLAPGDGPYWFAIRSIDVTGQARPATTDELQPGLKVYIDRRPPVITLRSAPVNESAIGVEWEIRDEAFDPGRFELDARIPGKTDWTPVKEARPTAIGRQYWRAYPGLQMEVRLRSGDRAENVSEATLILSPGAVSHAGDRGEIVGPAQPKMCFSNSTKIAIPYKLTNVGISGVSVNHLWVTRDGGKNWTVAVKANSDELSSIPINPSEAGDGVRRFQFQADGEGRYGFRVVTRSGVGLGDPDPRPGDPPRLIVEVDTTNPLVEMTAERGKGHDIRHIFIRWTAKDKNLKTRPVSLHYAEKKDGEWKPIANDLEAVGSYTWTVSDEGPFQFYVMARAEDRAGNVGTAQTPGLVTVDLSHPTADLLDPEPLPPAK